MKRTKKGFTLVELLVVIAIIAIIAAVAVPVTISQIDKAKKSTAASEANNAVSAIQTALVNMKTKGVDLTEAELIKELNTSFVGVKQISKIDIASTNDSGKTTVTVTTKVALDEAVKGEIAVQFGEEAAELFWSESESKWAEAADKPATP